jgi:hypothetical protein
MKTASATILSLMITVTQALASGGGDGEGLSLLATFFIAFGVLIVLFQFIPGIIMFGGMLKGIFSSAKKSKVSATGGNGKS